MWANKQSIWNDETLKEYIEGNSNCKYVSHTKDAKNIYLKLICSCGNEFDTSKGAFIKGKRQCNICGQKSQKSKVTKWNDESVRQFAETKNIGNFKYEGYERDGRIIKLKLICMCGSPFIVYMASYKKMKIIECPECAYKRLGENSRVWNNENLKEHVENNSKCEYISFERIKEKVQLTLKCKCGNIFKVDKGSFDKGKHQCNTCGRKKHTEKVTKWNDNNLKKVVENNSECKYIGFVRNKERHIFLKLKCPCGRHFQTTKARFDRGKVVCNVCNGFSEDYGKVSLAEKCPESLDLWDYDKNDDTPYDISYSSNKKRWFKCHNGIHESEYKLIGTFSSGCRCYACSTHMLESRLATTLKQVLKHEFPNTIWEYNIGFKGFNGGTSRYDIYVPELNLIIEVQSQYHDDQEQKLLDQQKKEYAINLGYEYMELDCRYLKSLDGIKIFFPNLKRIPKYVNDTKNTLLNWNIKEAQKLLDEDNDLTYEEIGKILGVPMSTIQSAVKDGLLNSSNHKVSKKNIKRKPVVQLSLNGEYINTFESVTKAYEESGASNISECCKGIYRYAGNYIWMYEEDYKNKLNNDGIKPQKSRGGSIVQLTMNGEYVATYEMIKDAVEKLEVTHSAICNCIKGKVKSCCGFKWMKEDDYLNMLNSRAS